jgi:hypothetical protein
MHSSKEKIGGKGHTTMPSSRCKCIGPWFFELQPNPNQATAFLPQLPKLDWPE